MKSLKDYFFEDEDKFVSVEYNPPTVSKVNYIEIRDSWVYIFNINYKLFLKKIRNICNSKNIQNLFYSKMK